MGLCWQDDEVIQVQEWWLSGDLDWSLGSLLDPSGSAHVWFQVDQLHLARVLMGLSYLMTSWVNKIQIDVQLWLHVNVYLSQAQ